LTTLSLLVPACHQHRNLQLHGGSEPPDVNAILGESVCLVKISSHVGQTFSREQWFVANLLFLLNATAAIIIPASLKSYRCSKALSRWKVVADAYALTSLL
jgi:hypothetical protein